MKKLNNLFVVAVFTLFIVASCETRIPEVDTTPPTFSFEIRGDGFNRKFTQDDDFSRMQLNLKSDTEYRFIYSGADQGGVALIRWQIGGRSQINLSQPEFPYDSWTSRDIPASIIRMIEWVGNDSNPKTGAILSGKFRTALVPENSQQGASFTFFVRDFGGRSRTPNAVQGELNMYILNSDTELREF